MSVMLARFRGVSGLFALFVLLWVPPGTGHAIELPDFTVLVERQGPSVVNISTTQAPRERRKRFPSLDEKDPMFDFFRRFAPRIPEDPKFNGDNRSLGSGFIISENGYIITNAHVIEDAEEILVRLVDKREYRARVIGADRRSDIAVIRIDAEGLPVVSMGEPDALKVGEWVVAIGSPFGFEHSVTAGIVSAKGRSLPDENFVPFIQTDVAINPGNSGGPLFNLKGEVVGVNSQIYSQTGGFMGLSFAIPIDVAMDVQSQLRSSGVVRRGRIGVAIQEVTRVLAESFGLPRAEGALVSSVEAGASADKAGVRQGDVIVRFDGRTVSNSSDLPRIVAATRPGAIVDMQIFRDGEAQTLSVAVGEWREDKGDGAQRAVVRADTINRLGIVVVMPTADQLDQVGAASGVIIDRMEGVAGRSDLREGDLIVAMVRGGRQMQLKSVADFDRLVAEVRPGEHVSLLVQRSEGSSYVSLSAAE